MNDRFYEHFEMNKEQCSIMRFAIWAYRGNLPNDRQLNRQLLLAYIISGQCYISLHFFSLPDELPIIIAGILRLNKLQHTT